MQLNGLAKFSSMIGLGFERWTTAVMSSGVSIELTGAHSDWRIETTPGGGARMRSMLAFTSAEVNGLPSWNFTPGRSLKVKVRRSGEMAQLSARSPVILGYWSGSKR